MNSKANKLIAFLMALLMIFDLLPAYALENSVFSAAEAPAETVTAEAVPSDGAEPEPLPVPLGEEPSQEGPQAETARIEVPSNSAQFGLPLELLQRNQYVYQLPEEGDVLISTILEDLGIAAVDGFEASIDEKYFGLVRVTDNLRVTAYEPFEGVPLSVRMDGGKTFKILLSYDGAAKQHGPLEAAIGPADEAAVEAAAAALGLQRVEIPVAKRGTKAAAADSAPQAFIRMDYFGLDLSVDEDRAVRDENGLFEVAVSFDAPMTLLEAEGMAVDGVSAQLYHIKDGAAVQVEGARFEFDGERRMTGFSFLTDSCSPYIVAYTVEFHYEGRTFALTVPGAKDIALSEILTSLEIVGEEGFDSFRTGIASVTVSDTQVFRLTEVEDGWLLRVLRESEKQEKLIISMLDGTIYNIGVSANGITELDTENNIAHISTVNDLYLPEEASAYAEIKTADEGSEAVSAVQASMAAEAGRSCQVFDIGLENVDLSEYNGFDVSIQLGQSVAGRDFRLYQVQDGAAADITDTLLLRGEADENGVRDVSGFTFRTDGFAEYVLCYTIETYYTAYDGVTFRIALHYGAEAEIPEGAELKVREILQDEEDFYRYISASAQELGVSEYDVSFARFFDIAIEKDGEVIEPKAPVRVTIAYQDALPLGEGAALKVVHFADAGTEVISDVSVTNGNTEITYQQSGFSVTGTLITDPGQIQQGEKYVVIVKKDDKYYSVLTDGKLERVYSAYDPETNTINVDIDYPLVWNYDHTDTVRNWRQEGNGWVPVGWWEEWWAGPSTSQLNYSGYNLSVPSTAIAFTEQNLPRGYYNRYINPNSLDPIVEEDEEQGPNTHLQADCALVYDISTHTIHGVNQPGGGNNGNYIGVAGDHIVGLASEENAAEIYLATINAPHAPDDDNHTDHTVNHIDISIAGTSRIRLPLAYGDYYDANGNMVFHSTPANHIIEMTPALQLEIKDMKTAAITATAIVNGENVPMNDVFYITGYSQNNETGAGNQAQVRVEGSFKVSNIPPYTPENWPNYYQYGGDADLDPDVRAARRANPIEYSVNVVKTLKGFHAEYNHTPLYRKDDDGNLVAMEFDIPINLSASFNFWMDTNECPPLHVGFDHHAPFVQEWIDGEIIGNGDAMSGMDFRLGTVGSDEYHPVPALEITKIIQREDGSYLYTTTSQQISLDIYKRESGDPDSVIDLATDSPIDPVQLQGLIQGYPRLHGRRINVGTNAIGAIYDYDVTDGMYFVRENPDSVSKYVTGTDGILYQYVSTRMETEYAWRRDGDDNKVHYADGTTSVPEVLGPYNNGELNNNFLEFYIFNIYKPVETVDVPVDKTWPEIENDPSYDWTATFVLEELEVWDSGPVSDEANTTVWRRVSDVMPLTISKGDGEAARTFTGLPKYRYYDNGSTYRIIYSVDETAYELTHNERPDRGRPDLRAAVPP